MQSGVDWSEKEKARRDTCFLWICGAVLVGKREGEERYLLSLDLRSGRPAHVSKLHATCDWAVSNQVLSNFLFEYRDEVEYCSAQEVCVFKASSLNRYGHAVRLLVLSFRAV